MKIVFSGGGTLGPVTPLLELRRVIVKHLPDTTFAWVGTKQGPEREIVEKAGVPFFAIGAGKWRRYFSWTNFLDIFRIIVAFFQSILFLLHERPDLLISAGGYVSVPLHWAGALLGIPSWIHQQDVIPGFAVKLMVPVARKVTTALEATAHHFPRKKTVWTGNPVRVLEAADRTKAAAFFGIPPDAPVVFALGGGTGSITVNRMILEAIASWPRDWHIIHLTGKERPGDLEERAAKAFPNYHVYKFFTDEMALAYSLADVVVARAGFGTLGELASLRKAAVIIPMPGTHQEANVRFFSVSGALLELHEGLDGGPRLSREVRELMNNPERRRQMGEKFHGMLPKIEEHVVLDIIHQVVD